MIKINEEVKFNEKNTCPNANGTFLTTQSRSPHPLQVAG
jgi:hypothetical protein